ncbi:hypothetical protein HCN44_000975 [Aphidius gifuensis]|uniref:Venom protein n=1 Tax=Aphidius gifuensis TaxID=684658 RepID=A0A834XMT0_APHGI|nr:hypothetical protein HCN44_000975 [Aphidius gifuensis]
MSSQLFFFLLKLILITQLIYHSNCDEKITNYQAAINYYPVELFNTTINNNYTDHEVKSKIYKIFNHTKACRNFSWIDGNILSAVLGNNDTDDIVNLNHTMTVVNDMFISVFEQKLSNKSNVENNHGDIETIIEAVSEINYFIHDKDNNTNFNLTGLLTMINSFGEQLKKKSLSSCSRQIPMDYQIFNIYNCLSLTILNGYALQINFLKDNSSSDDLKKIRGEMKRKLIIIAKKSRVFMKNTTQIIRQCDPKIYKEGINYIQLKNFLNTYIIGKQLLFNGHSCGFEKCENILRIAQPIDGGNRHQCQGNIHDCWTTSVQKICYPIDKNSSRTYQAFKSDKQQTLGPWKYFCEDDNNVIDYSKYSKDQQTIYGSHGLDFSVTLKNNCDICACTCDDYKNTNSIRKFSLQQVRSSHQQGVVTGVEIKIEHKVVVFKIQVGILIDGVIQPESESWNSSNILTLNPDGSELNQIDLPTEHNYPTVALHYDYKNIFLGNFYGPKGSFIQGIRFINCNDGISLSILATEYDANSSKLLPETAQWYGNCHIPLLKKNKINVPEKPDIPTNDNSQNIIMSKSNSYVTFQTTDWMDDGGQTTVPFFDTQRVMTNPPKALSGVGLYYKSHNKSGGFIGVQLIPSEYSYLLLPKIVNKNIDNFPPVINYYTNVLTTLFNGTNHSIEFMENEVDQIDRHSVACDNLFNMFLSEQHSNTWANYDGEFLSNFLQSMIQINNYFDDDLNNITNLLNKKDKSSDFLNVTAEYFAVDKLCGQLFDNWLNKLQIDTRKSDLYDKFFVSMLVFNKHTVNKNIERILISRLNESTESINNKIQKVFNSCVKCGKLYDILLDNKNSTTRNDYHDKLSLSKFLISMIILNKNMRHVGEKKIEGTYSVDNVDMEKDMIQPIIFLDELQKNEYQKDQDLIFDLKKSIKFMSMIHQKLKIRKNMECNNGLSIQQLLYSAYNCISLTAFNSYSMILSAYQAYSPIIRDNFSTFMTEQKRTELLNTLIIIANQSADVMANEKKFIRRCDPDNYQEGVNYERLKYFMHTNVIGLDYISRIFALQKYESCSSVPSFISPRVYYERFKCSGIIRDCKFFDLDKICFSNNTDDSRHYQSFKAKNGEVFGQWTPNCTGDNLVDYQYVSQVTTHNFGTTGILTGGPKSTRSWDICACTCDDIWNSKTTRYISLQEVRAKNHQGVVTGIKFGIDNGVIVLNIRVGIIDNYVVNSKMEGWNSTFVLRTNSNGSQPNVTQFINKNETHLFKSIGLDYNYRNFLLNTVVGPPGTVVQGVRFKACQDGISIDVLATKINNEGQVLSSTSRWYSACDNQLKREEVKIPANADVPTKSNLPNTLFTSNKENTFIKFQTTDWTADASQTIVPFFDTQEIITSPSAPLSGIGTFYKSHNKSGGFIALQLLTFDYNELMTSHYIKYNLEKLSTIT